MMRTSFAAIPSENYPIFPVHEPRKINEKGGFSMRTGLTKKQKSQHHTCVFGVPVRSVYMLCKTVEKQKCLVYT